MARVRRGVTFAAASAEFDVLAKQLAAMHPSDDDYPKKFTGRVVGANDYLTGISHAGKVFNSKIELKDHPLGSLGRSLGIVVDRMLQCREFAAGTGHGT